MGMNEGILNELGYYLLAGAGGEGPAGLMDEARRGEELGFGTEDDSAIKRLFQQKYRGSRYSFGYPACPNLEDRELLVQLLEPRAIGVELTENFMLVPEQSTDAIVSHHPQAKYFDV